MDAGEFRRDRSTAQGVSECGVGDALVDAMTQRRRFARAMSGERDVVLRVDEAVQNRRVLRKQQRGGEQQGTKKIAHAHHVFAESTPASFNSRVRQARQRQFRPGTGSSAGRDAHQQGACPACMPQVNAVPQRAQRESGGFFFAATTLVSFCFLVGESVCIFDCLIEFSFI